jgi:hypothetical protein
MLCSYTTISFFRCAATQQFLSFFRCAATQQYVVQQQFLGMLWQHNNFFSCAATTTTTTIPSDVQN